MLGALDQEFEATVLHCRRSGDEINIESTVIHFNTISTFTCSYVYIIIYFYLQRKSPRAGRKGNLTKQSSLHKEPETLTPQPLKSEHPVVSILKVHVHVFFTDTCKVRTCTCIVYAIYLNSKCTMYMYNGFSAVQYMYKMCVCDTMCKI